ncbi:MAG: prepilin-type N-terminal cleavage/methylation domain-containing protein [Candidatus Aminicenantes bacterium]|nr:prepilin-type N-terminal cleavage/methylation domain-containing protein [Candidatus Aminicenantes bacterium]
MRKGFTLIETLVALALLLAAVLFSARITIFALAQARQAGMRFRLLAISDYYKNYLSSLPFSAPNLADGSHRQAGREFIVTWRVVPAGTGLKKIDLLATGAHCSLPLFFFKSRLIQEVKND